MKFHPSLENGYRKPQKMEKDVLDVQKKIKWADHIVFVYPIWWGGAPAKFKGFIERVFLPGFAFKFERKSILPKRLLKGKSGRIFLVKGGTWLFYFGALASPGMIMRRFLFNFTGISPVRVKSFYSANRVDRERSDKIFNKVFKLGKRGK
jgi:NAD(P)H dehydrogenase (quinone)